MDLLSNNNSSVVKTPDAETESPTPTRIQPARVSPFSNGVLKRHAPLHLHHPVVVTYRECLKNHAAALGGHALDGCGEFMPSPASDPADPTSLTCAACGCHRNFHRREPEEAVPGAAIEYLSHRRHHPPPPPPPPVMMMDVDSGGSSPNNSPSPPPISSSYAPHMLMALSHGGGGSISAAAMNLNSNSNSNGRKRFRSKFTQFQKEKMLEFAEKLGWKMQKKDDDAITEFCSEIGVEKGVLKVWMHNNKTNFAKKDHQIATANPPESAPNGAQINCSAAVDEGKVIIHHHHNVSSSP